MTSNFEVATASGSYRSPTYDEAHVRDAMRHGVITCHPDAPLTDLARMMANYRVHSIVVTRKTPFEREGNEHLWGVVTDDMIIRSGSLAHNRTAGAVATTDVVTVRPDDALRDAVRAMVARGSSHAVVMDSQGSRPIGVLSTLDVAGVIGSARP